MLYYFILLLVVLQSVYDAPATKEGMLHIESTSARTKTLGKGKCNGIQMYLLLDQGLVTLLCTRRIQRLFALVVGKRNVIEYLHYLAYLVRLFRG